MEVHANISRGACASLFSRSCAVGSPAAARVAGMMRFAIRRALHSAALLLLISSFSFALLSIAPGTYVDAMRVDPSISPGTALAWRSRYGLDQPFAARYLGWLRSAFRGEFGISFAYGIPVGSLVWPRMKNTLFLTTAAATGSWLIAIPLGVAAATTRNRLLQHLIRGGTSFLFAIPDLLLALALLMLAVRARLVPAALMPGGSTSNAASGRVYELAAHMVLPLVALILVSLPVLVRHVDASVRDALRAPFITAARAYGIPDHRIWTTYALRAAANPLISLFGYSIGGLLSSSLLIEVVMGWPGLGPLLLESIFSRDVHVVIGATLTSALFLITGNLVADLLLYAADPRIRLEA